MDEIYDSLSKNENVILDTTNLSDTHKTELLKEISDKELEDGINNANYMTYRYVVDKDCNIKLYKVYDEVK